MNYNPPLPRLWSLRFKLFSPFFDLNTTFTKAPGLLVFQSNDDPDSLFEFLNSDLNLLPQLDLPFGFFLEPTCSFERRLYVPMPV